MSSPTLLHVKLAPGAMLASWCVRMVRRTCLVLPVDALNTSVCTSLMEDLVMTLLLRFSMLAEKKMVSPHTYPSFGRDRVAFRGPVVQHRHPNVFVPLLVSGFVASEK